MRAGVAGLIERRVIRRGLVSSILIVSVVGFALSSLKRSTPAEQEPTPAGSYQALERELQGLLPGG